MEKYELYMVLKIPDSRVEELKEISGFCEKEISFYNGYSKRNNLIKNIIEYVKERIIQDRLYEKAEPIELKELDPELKLLIEFDECVSAYCFALKHQGKEHQQDTLLKLIGKVKKINQKYA